MSLFRAKLWDARSPIVGGLGQIVPTTEPPESAGFGTSWALEEETDYYAASMEWIEDIPGTDDVAAFRVFSSNEGIKRITPGGAGTPVWAATPNVNMRASGTIRGQCKCTADYVFAGYRFSTLYRITRIPVGTGVSDWEAVTSNVSAYGVAINSDASQLFGIGGGSANGCKLFDGTSVSVPSAVNYTLSGDGGMEDCDITRDDAYLVTLDTNEQLNVRALSGLPGSGAWAVDTRYDLTADVSTAWASITTEAWCKAARAAPLDSVWICSRNSPTALYRLSCASKSELIKIDVAAVMSTLTGGASSSDTLGGLCVDINGDLYVVWRGSISATTRTHVLRFDNDGNYVTSTYDQGITMTSTGTCADITVTEEGSICLAEAAGSGFYTRISQS